MSEADVAVVTGASGGIGGDIARVLARRGSRVVLAARSEDKLAAIGADLKALGAPDPILIPVDLAAPEGPARVEAALRERGLRASILVNNAGFGLLGRARALSRAEQLEMIDLNIRALVDITLRLTPDLIAARGRLMNVASVAAFVPGPGMAVYYATKAFVLSFSQAMAEELKADGVSVTALCPGLTPTGFQARAGMGKRLERLAPMTPSMLVAESGVAGMFAGRRVVVPGAANRAFTAIAPFLPRALLLPLLLRTQAGRAGTP
jgi:hypothetical protein